MKYISIVTILLIVSGCSSQNTPTPTQNEALNRISTSTAKKKKAGWMQRHLDNWMKNDWEKHTKGFKNAHNKKVSKKKRAKSQKKQRKPSMQSNDNSFTLQHYVDKAAYYIKNKPKCNNHSHVEEIEKLPVIGGGK